ncbi:MAG: PKD domain-containing protein [Chthoniobacterales bacterium]
MLAVVGFASTPSSATLTDKSGPIKYTAGPFLGANAHPVFLVDNGPVCDDTDPCDIFKLTLQLPSGYAAAHPKAVVRARMSWQDTGTGQSDYDLYIYKTPRADCSPNDCTAPDGSQQADAVAASGQAPTTSVAVTSDKQTFTFIIVPVQPTGETVNVVIDLLPGSPGALTAGFGGPDPTSPGVPRYMNFIPPSGSSAESNQGEFNIGYNPATGRIMTMNTGPVWRITPPELLKPAKPECCDGLWEDKSAQTTNTGLDPILWTDQKTGRTFVSNSTVGANAVYAYTDNDGDTYVEGSVAPPNGGADHESIGSGPYPATLAVLGTPVNQGEAVYYCSQDIVGPASCQRSDTLGASYGPGVLAYNGLGTDTPGGTDCGGLHGHLHVAPDGTVWLPVNQCGGKQGGVFSTDGGVTWTEFAVPNAHSQRDGADPSIAIDANSTIYYSYVNNEPVGKNQPLEGHAHVAVGKLNHTTNEIAWLNDTDIGATHGITNAVEIEAVGGSAGRAGVGFIGTNLSGDYQQVSFPGEWYAFIATTYDEGKNWVTVNATPNDPVQSRTGVWQEGGSETDRNLLDFDEITIDKNGRVLFGYSDGCVTTGCIGGTAPNDFVGHMRVARQTGGKSLFASFDSHTDTAVPVLAKAPCLSGTRDVTGSHLSWKAPDNGGSHIIRYFIYRGTTSGGEDFITPIGQTIDARTSFTDPSADPSVKDYFYVVKAVTSVGFGAASNEVDLKLGAIVPPAVPYSCSGDKVVTDAAGDAINPAGVGGSTDQADITAVSFKLDQAKTKITTVLTLKNLSSTPTPGTTSTIYWVAWTGSNGKQYATRHVEPDPAGTSYTYGEFDGDSGFVSGTSASTTGTFNPGPNGTITVDVPRSAIGNPAIPVSNLAATPAVRQPHAITFAGEGALGAGLFFTQPMDKAPNTGGGQKWAVCLPANAAPTAILKGNVDHGPAPLKVDFSGAGSTDPDGDTIASYAFDFGDGSAPVTQSSPTISHTYQHAGEFPAHLTVKDSRGLPSTNISTFVVEVNAVLRNISTRSNVQTGDNVMIGGFIITGNQSRSVLIRALGPSITANGKPLAGTLQDPTLELHDSTGVTIATNDDWKKDDETGQSQQTAIEGTGAPPSNDKESALVRTLPAGKYTAIVRGKDGTTGLALVEAYDLNPFATSRLANISTRSFVGTKDDVMIAGFIAGPSNAAPTRVLIRGLGPSLTARGVPDALADPTLELHDADGNLIRANDNWRDSQEADIQATGAPPENNSESAILTDVSPGNYTAILAGKANGTGNGLVEVFDVDIQ